MFPMLIASSTTCGFSLKLKRREIQSNHILKKVKIRWIVTYLHLRRMQSQINGIGVYGPRI